MFEAQLEKHVLIHNQNMRREYCVSKLNMSEARTKFAIRTKMTKSVKLNYKNDPVNKNSL